MATLSPRAITRLMCDSTGRSASYPNETSRNSISPFSPEPVDHRHNARLIPHDVQMRPILGLASGLEPLALLPFLRQPLHDPDGRERLLRQGGELAGAGTGLAGGKLDTSFVAEDRQEQ